MERKAWALINYGLNILLLFVILLIQGADDRLVVALLLIVNLVSLLVLLSCERHWDATHWLGLCLLILTAAFVILFVGTSRTGVSYLYGASLILATLVVFIAETVAGWRGTLLGRLLSHFHGESEPEKDEEEHDLIVEEIMPHHERRLLTRKGTILYHKEGCIALRNVPKTDLVEISDGEALAYGLTPCKACKPYRE